MPDNADDSTSTLDPAYFETKIPVEILHRIFELTLPYVPRGDVAASPWRLGQLNSRTRAVVLTAPSFWSDIRVDSRARLGQGSAGQARTHARLLTQLERSRSAPLRIWFRALPYANDALDTVLLMKLCEASHRWVQASFDLPLTLASGLLVAAGKLPLLRYLAIRVPSGEGSLDHPDPAGVFSDAPSLSELDVLGYRYSRQFPFLVPLHQLVCLDAEWAPELYSDVFPHTKNLVELRLSEPLWGGVPGSLVAAGRVALNKLELLRAPGLEFLLTVSLPALRHLVVAGTRHSQSILDRLDAARPGGRLRSVVCTEGSWEAVWLLEGAPAVTHLGLGIGNSSDLLLRSLTPPPAPTFAQPVLLGRRLTSITLLIDEMVGEGAFALGEELLKMVRARMNSTLCPPLTHLAITSHALCAADIRALREIEGLDLRLVSFRHSLPPVCDQPEWARTRRMQPWGAWKEWQPTAHSNACMALDWMRSSSA